MTSAPVHFGISGSPLHGQKFWNAVSEWVQWACMAPCVACVWWSGGLGVAAIGASWCIDLLAATAAAAVASIDSCRCTDSGVCWSPPTPSTSMQGSSAAVPWGSSGQTLPLIIIMMGLFLCETEACLVGFYIAECHTILQASYMPALEWIWSSKMCSQTYQIRRRKIRKQLQYGEACTGGRYFLLETTP